MVAIAVRYHHVVHARGRVVLGEMLDDGGAGHLIAAVHDVHRLLPRNFVTQGDRIAAAIGFHVQKIDLEEVRHIAPCDGSADRSHGMLQLKQIIEKRRARTVCTIRAIFIKCLTQMVKNVGYTGDAGSDFSERVESEAWLQRQT